MCETSARSLLSKCVSAGIVSQEEIGSASLTPAFTSGLLKAEQRITAQRQLKEVQLQLELLRLEQQSTDVTNSFYLGTRCELFQMCSEHLQQLLRERPSLRQRLISPLITHSLQLPAHLHRSVVESLKLMLSFMEMLEEKISSAHKESSIREKMDMLSSSLAHLLAQATEVESLTNQLLTKEP
ncbi:HAUS augmin-like complex subunit 2 [Gouania willdenowi]|uniref:HAUS augmin-like complex subunit 2 n=1 Tax=Gouania willdenowi TaxID=441366 RepID=UPI001055EA97|nr:HAUS augmin-like complex subunit 2 [Gouania willdenowi]